MSLVLAINPGGGSTKIAVFDDERCVLRRSIGHPHDELLGFTDAFSQRSYREQAVMDALEAENMKISDLDAFVGRGGALKPLESGTYRVTEALVEDIKAGRVQAEHASNLGALIAFDLAEPLGKPAFMVDPVSVDEFTPEARLSGLPEIERKSLDHPLNAKMVARKAAAELGTTYREINAIVAHLGTGISVSAHRRGRMIDVNNANDGGPFSTQRAGNLPATQLVRLCYKGDHTCEEMIKKITTRGGLKAYLGTDDMAEAETAARGGDKDAERVIHAMVYQVAKEVGACAAALDGEVNAVIFTGGIAFSDYVIGLVRKKVGFITPHIFVYPGEHELESMVLGALRVLRGEEEPKTYR
jgi:butyrate kinase